MKEQLKAHEAKMQKTLDVLAKELELLLLARAICRKPEFTDQIEVRTFKSNNRDFVSGNFDRIF